MTEKKTAAPITFTLGMVMSRSIWGLVFDDPLDPNLDARQFQVGSFRDAYHRLD